MTAGLRLERGGGPALVKIGAINAALAPFGTRVWPLDLGGVAPDIRTLLVRSTLDAAQADEIKTALLLSREALLRNVRCGDFWLSPVRFWRLNIVRPASPPGRIRASGA